MDIASRIAQFENMAQADPTNEMAHFSLGGAYLQAERFADAAESYLKAIALNPDLSKAYQLAGDALVKAGKKDRAVSVLSQGYIIAAQKGDLMPKNGIAALLKSLGEPVPEVEQTTKAAPGAPTGVSIPHDGPLPEGMILCRQSGRPGRKMSRRPFKGPVGEWILANISQETFDLWIRQGTKVINELRLDLSREKDNEIYDQHMREFLGMDDALFTELTGPKKA